MIKVSKKNIEEIVANQMKSYGGTISPEWNIEKQVEENYSEVRVREDWDEITKYVSVGKTDKILDLGCGYGFLVTLLRIKGYLAYGCDTDIPSIKIAKELLKENGHDPKIVVNNNNLRLPYPAENFDFINLNYVLVYVKDRDILFREIKRVLKKNGKVYLITPNYQCCYDVNYGLFLFYFLPRRINKFYLRLVGRKNLIFFDSLNFTTKRNLEKVFKKNNFSFDDIGIKNWLSSFKKPSFSGRSNAYKSLINLIKTLHLVKSFQFFAKLGFYTPLIYILKNEH